MFRLALIAIISIHALIHLLGFLKAFEFAEISQLTKSISRPMGLLWLLAAILFFSTAVAFTIRKDWWWMIGLITVLISQFAIMSSWQDAKFGTVANLIIGIACLLSYGQWNFDRFVNLELQGFMSQRATQTETIHENATTSLPEPVRNWLRQSGIIGREKISTVHLWQTGKMRLKPESSWLPVTATQWFTTAQPGFLWRASVGKGSLMQFVGRDKYQNGKGNMRILLFGLLPIVDAKGEKIDQGVAIRYLAEIIWFPSAALSEFITWEAIDEKHARATLQEGGNSVSGIFSFSKSGQVLSFETMRYYSDDGSLQPWHIAIDSNSYKVFDGIVVPTKASVTWKLQEGNFTWYILEVRNLQYEY